MACEYKFNGVILSEQQFHRLTQRAYEMISESTAKLEELHPIHVASIISSLNLEELNENSINKLDAVNQMLQDKYNTDLDFVGIDENGTVTIYQDSFDEINKKINDSQEITNETLENAMTDILFGQANELTGYSYDAAKTNKFAKVIAYKQSLVNRLEKYKSQLQAKKAQYNPKSEEYGKILQLEKEIDRRLNGHGFENEEGYVPGLVREIQRLRSSEGNIDILFDYLHSDVQRLATLTERTDVESINEAKVIMAFMKAIHSTDSSGSNKSIDNPILDSMQLKDDLYKDTILRMKEFARNIIDIYEDKIKQREVDILTEIVKSDPDLVKIFGQENVDYQKFFGRMLAMKDISWYDDLMMDGTVGTFSDFGHIPQLAKKILTESITKFRAKESEWNEKLSGGLITRVNEKLRKLGYGIKLAGIFNYGASYNLFRQTYSNGQKTNRMVDRFSAEYIDQWARVQNEFRRLLDRANKDLKGESSRTVRRQAYFTRYDWRKKNTVFVDPSRIAEFANNPDFAEFKSYFVDDNGQHENEIKSHLNSSIGYAETIAEQKDKIYRFQAERIRMLKNLFEQYQVNSINNLDENAQYFIKKWDEENNPFKAAKYFHDGYYMSSMKGVYPDATRFSTIIPKRNIDGKETGFYDKNFETIEADADLYEFWKLSDEIFTECRKYLPLDKQREMAYNTIAGKSKSFTDILTDPDLAIGEKMIKALWHMKDSFKQSFMAVESSKNANNKLVDTITNEEQSEVSLKMIQTNGDEIRKNFTIQAVQFIQSLSEGNRRLFINSNKKLSMNKYSKIPFSALTSESKELLASYLGVPSGDVSLKKAAGIDNHGNIEIGKIIYKTVVSRIVENETFNLPQILKLYSKGSMLYAARTSVKPVLDIMKEHFKQIRKPNETNAGTEKSTFSPLGRTRANKNFEKWFDKHVLGNTSTKVIGLIKGKMMNHISQQEDGKNGWMFNIALSSLTEDEKKLYKIIQDEIDRETKLGDKGSQETIDELKAIQERLGKNFAFGAFIDRFFDLTRMVGLALSPSGAFFNYMAGKFTNYIHTGVYYSEEAMWRAENIVMGSHIKLTGAGKISDGSLKSAKKLAILMKFSPSPTLWGISGFF